MSYNQFETEDKKSLTYFKPSTEGDITCKADKGDFIGAAGLPVSEVEARLKTLNNEQKIWDLPGKNIRARYWTNPKKDTGITFERYCGAITAFIVGVRFKEHPEYGRSVELVLRQPSGVEAIYSTPTKGQYGMGLMERLPNVDFEKPVRISVYSKQNGERTNYYTTLEQAGVKIESFFRKYDEEKKEWIMLNGHPGVDEKEKKKFGEDYFRTRYYPESSIFMVEYIEKNVAPKVNELTEVVTPENDADDVTVVPDESF